MELVKKCIEREISAAILRMKKVYSKDLNSKIYIDKLQMDCESCDNQNYKDTF